MALTAIKDSGLCCRRTASCAAFRRISLTAPPERLERHFTLTPLEGDSAEEWRTSLAEAG
jgi:hypothetical protein